MDCKLDNKLIRVVRFTLQENKVYTILTCFVNVIYKGRFCRGRLLPQLNLLFLFFFLRAHAGLDYGALSIQLRVGLKVNEYKSLVPLKDGCRPTSPSAKYDSLLGGYCNLYFNMRISTCHLGE